MTAARDRAHVIRVRSKVWVERDGEVLISEYRARLLEAVARAGSVAAGAEAMGLPYRTAWKKLREMEAAAGVPLLDSGSGGSAEVSVSFATKPTWMRPFASPQA